MGGEEFMIIDRYAGLELLQFYVMRKRKENPCIKGIGGRSATHNTLGLETTGSGLTACSG